jgi:hypothetical protein
LLSATLVVGLVLVAVSSAPSVDGSIAADWGAGFDMAVRIWLLGHGAPVSADGVTITLLPLGLTLASGAFAASVARRLAAATRGVGVVAGLTYGALVAVVAATVGLGGAVSLRAGAVGAAVCAVGATAGLSRRGFHFWDGIAMPTALRVGVRLGLGTSALVGAAGAATVLVWTVSSWGDVTGAAQDLGSDLGGGFALAAGETAYVPTLTVCAVSWLAGPGFAFGEGSHYGTGDLTAGTVPGLPLLQVLPGSAGGALALLPVLFVALGSLARIVIRRSLGTGPEGYVSQGVAILVVGGAWGVLAAAASGAIGGGALTEVGPRPLGVAVAVAALTGAGMLATSLAEAAWKTSTRRTYVATTPPPRPVAPPPPPQTRESNDPLRLW